MYQLPAGGWKLTSPMCWKIQLIRLLSTLGPGGKTSSRGLGPTLGRAGELNGGGGHAILVGAAPGPWKHSPPGAACPRAGGPPARPSLFSEQPEPGESCGAPASQGQLNRKEKLHMYTAGVKPHPRYHWLRILPHSPGQPSRGSRGNRSVPGKLGALKSTGCNPVRIWTLLTPEPGQPAISDGELKT